MLLTVGWGKNGTGSLQDPVLDLHGPHLDQPICLIMNEWIQSVSKQPWSPRCRHTRTMHPTKRPSKLKKSLNCKEGENIKAKEKRKRRGARQDLELGVRATMCHETPASVQLGQLQRRQLAPHSSFIMTSDCGVKITDLGPNFTVASVLISFWCRFRTSRAISLGFCQHANDVHATYFQETPVNLIFFCVLLSKYGLLTQKNTNTNTNK